MASRLIFLSITVDSCVYWSAVTENALDCFALPTCGILSHAWRDSGQFIPYVTAATSICLRKNAWWTAPDLVDDSALLLDHYVMMGIGQVIVMRFPPNHLRRENLAIESVAWGAYQTEFYVTYDLRAARTAQAASQYSTLRKEA